MNILVANPGSTSYKCKLYNIDEKKIIYQSAIDRIGEEKSSFLYKFHNSDETKEILKVPDYFSAIDLSIKTLEKSVPVKDIDVVGFKVVLAKGITGCVELTDKVLDAMTEYLPLAPVHNRIYLNAISIFKKILPKTKLAGLFETSFHKDILPEAYLFGVPYEWFEKYGIRKYGFHGASHSYIAARTKELFFPDKKNIKIISCHLGGSSSVCAIKDGVSIDTSMGMSPQYGLPNAKRVGDRDPFNLFYIIKKENLSIDTIQDILINKSGLLGISGFSGDFRDIENEMKKNNKRAVLAFKVFAYSVKKYIGQYLAVLNSADCITFTGGIGQNSPSARAGILSNMEKLGVALDEKKNIENPKEGLISAGNSHVKIAVVPTDEEYVVALEIKKLFVLRHNGNEDIKRNDA